MPRRRRCSPSSRALPAEPGYFTQTFCVDSRYFQPKNGARIDAMREALARMALQPELEAIALVALMEAADRVDSTVGLQMAYLKQWAARAFNDLELRMPALVGGRGHARCSSTRWSAREQGRIRRRVHRPAVQPAQVHEQLPRVGVARALGQARRSTAWRASASTAATTTARSTPSRASARRCARWSQSVRARYLLVSFNDEGYLSEEDLREVLSRARPGRRCSSVDFKRYVGAKIGIYNPSGVKTGKVSHLRNRELLFLVACDGARRIELGRLQHDLPSRDSDRRCDATCGS